MNGRALVTGATGMLGSYIVERLRVGGWCVAALTRSPTGDPWLEEIGARPVQGRLEDAESLVRAASGMDVVFHAAAAIGSGGDWESFRKSNVVGTRNVVRAAARAGARLLHVSSTSVFGSARYREGLTDEAVPLPDLPDHDVYGRSKQEAEEVVLEAHRTGELWAAVVRPPVMYGLRDRQFAPRVGPVLARGIFPLIGGGGTTLSLVHAGNVADGAILAASRSEANGQVYLLTDDFPVTVADLVRYAQEGFGTRVYAPDVPLGLGRAGFAALKSLLYLTGRGDLARHARGTLEMLTRDNPFTSARARQELGWSPAVPPRIGLTEAMRWWNSRTSASVGSGR